MKKILCLMLVLSFAFALVSCNGGGDDTPNSDSAEKTLEEIVADSTPTKVKTYVDFVYPEKNSLSEYALGGEYVLEVEGSDSIFTYSYTRLAALGESDDMIVSENGKVYYKDGKFSADGETFGAGVATPTDGKFNLVRSAFKSYTKSEDGKTLSAIAEAANMSSVLGVDIEATGDVIVIVTTNGVYLTSVTITYQKADGAKVVVETSYTYNPLDLTFPGDEE